jgi:hypothetical protein
MVLLMSHSCSQAAVEPGMAPCGTEVPIRAGDGGGD